MKYTSKLILNGTEYEFGAVGGGEWQPGENTVAYYEFNNNLNDSSGNSHDLTLRTGTVSYGTTQQGAKYVHLTKSAWTNYITYSDYNYSTPITVSVWRYLIQDGTSTIEMWGGSSGELYRLGGSYVYGMSGTNNYSLTNYQNQWQHILITRTGNDCAIYITGQQTQTGTGRASGTYNLRFLLNNAGDTSSSIHATECYLSELIWEDKVWTSDEITAYFNSTKSLYGIS